MAGVRLAQVEVSAGGVIHRRLAAGAIEVLLIRDSYGNWGFPKGHVEPGETRQAAALRECREETGLTRVALAAEVATTDWHFRAGGTWVHKFCDYFLLVADPAEEPRPQVAEGIRECVWLDPVAAAARITYENARHILGRAVQRAEEAVQQPAISRGRGK
ncbi:MAG TPA: NUDIX domain-containing protein [Gemmatimonadota bacterium]|nr:NUDIX domain-containing protein [Gemmatimonadota bacterium]